MVENGLLSEEKEFYAPVRLRGGKQMSDLPKTGIRKYTICSFSGTEYIVKPCSFNISFSKSFNWINSSVSTGGDSIDMTDVIDDSYKQIAIEAVAALGAKICGIDLIIPDKDVKGTRDSLTYGIIEANFNPAMHMHVYPYAGQGRRLTMDVLKLLYPEVVQ